MLKRQSSWVKMWSLVIVTVMLWPCAVGNTAAQETRKKSYDLSARKTGDVLKLKPEVWTEINRFVFMIAFDIYQPAERIKSTGIWQPDTPGSFFNPDKPYNKLDSYYKLYQACVRWRDTFQNLQRLADELSTGDIRKLLKDMKSAVERRPNDPVGAEKAFAAAADELMGKISEWERLSKDVKEDIDSLSTQTHAAAIQMKTDKSPEARRIVDVEPELADVVAALARVNDHWGALSSGLSALREEMATNLHSKDPFMLGISLDIGLTSWESVEAAAKTFVTNIPAQRRNLIGDNYYDECPLNQAWYWMQTKHDATYWRAEDAAYGRARPTRTGLGIRTLKTSGATYLLLNGQRISGVEPDPDMQWMFERVGHGWWRIINRAEGYSKGLGLLDTNSDKENALGLLKSQPLRHPYFPIIDEVKFYFTSQPTYDRNIAAHLWRCVPTGEGDYFRIYNAYLGEKFSLKMDSHIHNLRMDIRMDMSSNAPEQYWHFEPIPIKEQ